MLPKFSHLVRNGLVLAVSIVPALAHSETWQLKVGAQADKKAHQVKAFLPNEIWVHAGDSITWRFASDDEHTVTFLLPGQVRPAFQVGCPGTTPDGSLETGTQCVNSGVSANGNSYTVTFPVAGNFKLVCLVHIMMTATVHVLDLSQPLPYSQAFYDREADQQRDELLFDTLVSTHHVHAANVVEAGGGSVVATGGGFSTASVARFMEPTKVVHVGETVEWTNFEASTIHTVTFGAEPANLPPPSANVTLDADGARHAVISLPSDSAHSGFIGPAPQDRTGLAQAPLGVTRFRVTFTQPGVFKYICALHDEIGMVGEVIVLP